MAIIEPRTEFCLWCGKKCEAPDGYDPMRHKFVCGPICGALELCFIEAFCDDNITARTMYQQWKKQTQ